MGRPIFIGYGSVNIESYTGVDDGRKRIVIAKINRMSKVSEIE